MIICCCASKIFKYWSHTADQVRGVMVIGSKRFNYNSNPDHEMSLLLNWKMAACHWCDGHLSFMFRSHLYLPVVVDKMHFIIHRFHLTLILSTDI